MDTSTSALNDQAHYKHVCQGLRSFYVCVIEDEDSNGNVSLLAHETSLRHARFTDAQKRQDQARRSSKSWIAECTLLPDSEKDQDPVTAQELAHLFDAIRKDPQSSWMTRKAKQRVLAWLKQNSASDSQPF